MELKNIYVKKTDSVASITISELSTAAPVLWCNGGLWGLICKDKITNMIQLMDDARSMPEVYTPPEFKVFWGEVVLIPKMLAEAICQR